MPESHECWFDNEKLEVYREAIAFVAWLSGAMESTIRAGEVKDQLDRASTSIPLNIAEGNGKYMPKDRCRFFDIAHGSALECAAGLDILVAKGKLMNDHIRPGKERFNGSCACSWASSSGSHRASTRRGTTPPSESCSYSSSCSTS